MSTFDDVSLRADCQCLGMPDHLIDEVIDWAREDPVGFADIWYGDEQEDELCT